MKERDYIDATDLRSLDLAKDALRHIVPDNQPKVDKTEFQTVYRLVTKWRDAIYAEVERRSDEEYARETEREWQQIVTAPKDGTPVHLQRVVGNEVVWEGTGYYGSVRTTSGNVFHNVWAHTDGVHLSAEAPTHWKRIVLTKD